MSGRKITAWYILPVLVLVACANDEFTAPTATVGQWEICTPPYAGAWTHCDVTEDGTLWATMILDGSKRAAIVKFDGRRWYKVEFEPSETEALNDVRVFEDGRGWACGNNGAIVEYDDGRWYPRRIRPNFEFFHLGAYDTWPVWVNGLSRPGNAPAIYFNSGTGWQEIPALTGYTSYGPIYMTGDFSGYMIGRTENGDEILTLQGITWGPAISFNEPLHFFDITGADGKCYAAGELRAQEPYLGRVYQLAPSVKDITPDVLPSDEYYYKACYADQRGGLWVSAAPYDWLSEEPYRLLYYDATGWREVNVGNETSATTRFFEIDFAGGHGWAVGGKAYARYEQP
ncbi:MAG: hypothetical protein PVH29_09715 [Candidatus Zixiibacteriota bacterium]